MYLFRAVKRVEGKDEDHNISTMHHHHHHHHVIICLKHILSKRITRIIV
jgi:hypothetical protein